MPSSGMPTGSGGTGRASVVRGGAEAGPPVPGPDVGGGAGCARGGGCFFAHATAVRLSKTSTTPTILATFATSRLFSVKDFVEFMRPRKPI
jgi:hypothetical protein